MSLLFCEMRNDILRFQKWDMQPTTMNSYSPVTRRSVHVRLRGIDQSDALLRPTLESYAVLPGDCVEEQSAKSNEAQACFRTQHCEPEHKHSHNLLSPETGHLTERSTDPNSHGK
jgi:hypothetical protein